MDSDGFDRMTTGPDIGTAWRLWVRNPKISFAVIQIEVLVSQYQNVFEGPSLVRSHLSGFLLIRFLWTPFRI